MLFNQLVCVTAYVQDPFKCIVAECKKQQLPGKAYCSDMCIFKHATAAVKKIEENRNSTGAGLYSVSNRRGGGDYCLIKYFFTNVLKDFIVYTL